MKLRYLALGASLMAAVSANAFSLDPSWAGGYVPFGSSPNGDTATLNNPIHISSGDASADVLAGLIDGNPQWFASTPTVVREADVAGTLSLDHLAPRFGLNSTDGRYYTGWNFDARFNTPDGSSIPNALRWVCLEQGDGGTWIFGFGPMPYFNADNQEQYYRDGSNQYGAYNYEFSTNIATEWGVPGDYSNSTTLFLVDESTDPLNGGLDVNIHDAMQFTQNYHQVPAPEPASIALIGLGVIGLLRRRRS